MSKICQECNKVITSKTRRIYCSEECYIQSNSRQGIISNGFTPTRKKKVNGLYPYKCEVCGRSESSKVANRKYCGSLKDHLSCMHKATMLKQEEYRQKREERKGKKIVSKKVSAYPKYLSKPKIKADKPRYKDDDSWLGG